MSKYIGILQAVSFSIDRAIFDYDRAYTCTINEDRRDWVSSMLYKLAHLAVNSNMSREEFETHLALCQRNFDRLNRRDVNEMATD